MVKEWATVVSWQNGEALLHCNVKASCNGCATKTACGSRILNQLGPQTAHTIVVPCQQPLVAGQKVELGLAETSLLGSAVLVYITPLAGLFIFAFLFQLLFGSDLAAISGAFIGSVGGFLFAKGVSPALSRRESWQPVILNIALPSNMLHIDTHESSGCK